MKSLLKFDQNVISVLSDEEMLLVLGGDEIVGAVNNAGGNCSFTNNSTGKCDVQNNGIGTCTSTNSASGICSVVNGNNGVCKNTGLGTFVPTP